MSQRVEESLSRGVVESRSQRIYKVRKVHKVERLVDPAGALFMAAETTAGLGNGELIMPDRL